MTKLNPNASRVNPTWANWRRGQNLAAAERQQAPSYDYTSYGSEYPIYSKIVSPDSNLYPQILPNGTFIGSLPLSFVNTGSSWEDIDAAIRNSQTQNGEWKLWIPSIENVEGIKAFFEAVNKLLVPSEESLKWKEVKDLEAIADKVKEINPDDYQILIEILSQQWLSLPNTVRDSFSVRYHQVITDYTVKATPDKEPEYEDLSAYLQAPFPELTIEPTEENPELQKILDKLNELGLEDLDIPLVEVNNKDLTERTIDGAGVFDAMMTATFNHLLKVRKDGLITQAEIAEIYKAGLVQNIQVASSFTLEKANILNQSYNTKINAAATAAQILNTKAQLLMLPIQIRNAYAQLEVQLKQLELLKVQIQLEKEKFPQVVAQTDLILAQTDGQRLQNESVQVGIQQNKLGLEQSKQQIALMEEQNKQTRLQTYGIELQNKQNELQHQVASATAEYQINQAKIATETADEQRKTVILQGNKLVEDTKLVDAQTQQTLKQVMLADVQKQTAEAQIRVMGMQLEKEKESLGLVKAQIASAFAQMALYKDQLIASRAQYSDSINGKPIGGLLGAQILANKVQASSLERKAFMEMVQQLQSGWAANKTADIAIKSPAAFAPIVIDKTIQWGLENYFNMPKDTMNMPYGYSQYLTDDEMDGIDTERGVAQGRGGSQTASGIRG